MNVNFATPAWWSVVQPWGDRPQAPPPSPCPPAAGLAKWARVNRRFHVKHQWRSGLVAALLAIALGAVPDLLRPQAARSADSLIVSIGPLELSLTTEALEEFAATGRVTKELNVYSRYLTAEQLAQFRQVLQRRFAVNPVVVAQFTYSPMGERLLQQLGNVIRTDARQQGFFALRSALILSAADRQGASVLGFIRNYPTPSIRISGGQLLDFSRQLTTLLDYRDATLRAIAQAATNEIATTPATDFASLPDLQRPGPLRVTRRTLRLSRDRRLPSGRRVSRPFQVDIYLPEGTTQPASVVVISHGLGSSPAAFAYLGRHLASHGFVAVLPQHIGSDATRQQAVLQGILGSPATPAEFVDRPLDIRFTLDTLERLSTTDLTYRGRMNLQQVGVIGHSFGGYTALALAGADLNFRRIHELCTSAPPTLNVSPLLQCLVDLLPPFNFQLRDPRVKAAIAISPLTSVVFGPETLPQVQVPVMMVAGSSDVVASAVLEQIHPFLWLQAPQKYLAVAIPSGHTFADDTPAGQGAFDQLGEFLSGPNPAQARQYINALSVALMQRHLNNRPEFDAYLSAGYARSISREPLELELVRSLTATQLEAAFGGPAPLAIVPQLRAVTIPNRSESVLAEVRRTGVLRAAVRQEAFPFSSSRSGQPIGFCVDLLNGLAAQLQQQLNRPVQLDLTSLTSLDTRFQDVQRGRVQIECGPNTIQPNLSGVTFSAPFLISGTQLLVRRGQAAPDQLLNLSGRRVGVLRNALTEQVVIRQFPAANLVRLPNQAGVGLGVRSLVGGQIDAFASDGVLLLAEVIRQNLPLQNYSLVPETPLSCEVYGMALPNNDPAWQRYVDDFLATPQTQQTTARWFTDLLPYVLLSVDYCIEQE